MTYRETWALLAHGTEISCYDDTTDFYGKSLRIEGPGELELEVDFDDCDHETVVAEAVSLVRMLNEAGSLS